MIVARSLVLVMFGIGTHGYAQSTDGEKSTLYRVQCNAPVPMQPQVVKTYATEEMCFDIAATMDRHSGCMGLPPETTLPALPSLPQHSYYCEVPGL